MKKIFTIFTINILVLFSCCALSWAGIRIDNPKVRMLINPGDYETGEIKVENRDGEQPVSVKVYLEDWISNTSEDTGSDKVFMPKGTTPLSCSGWITFSPAEFTLPAGESQSVQYTVTAPEEAQGGYYSVMFFESEGGIVDKINEEGENVKVKILNRLGSLFYVEAKGTIKKTAEIKNLNLAQKLNDFLISGDFINTGNTDIAVTGTFNVIDSQGFVYARGEFNRVFVLPQEKKILTAKADSVSLKAGRYDLLITLDFEGGGTLVQEAPFTVSAEGNMQQTAS